MTLISFLLFPQHAKLSLRKILDIVVGIKKKFIYVYNIHVKDPITYCKPTSLLFGAVAAFTIDVVWAYGRNCFHAKMHDDANDYHLWTFFLLIILKKKL